MKIVLFIETAARTSNPTDYSFVEEYSNSTCPYAVHFELNTIISDMTGLLIRYVHISIYDAHNFVIFYE
jgi:hypothetical protein